MSYTAHSPPIIRFKTLLKEAFGFIWVRGKLLIICFTRQRLKPISLKLVTLELSSNYLTHYTTLYVWIYLICFLLVWQSRRGNPKFFKANHPRLALKAHIRRFNELLERQVELMSQTRRGVPSASSTNGSHIHSSQFFLNLANIWLSY